MGFHYPAWMFFDEGWTPLWAQAPSVRGFWQDHPLLMLALLFLLTGMVILLVLLARVWRLQRRDRVLSQTLFEGNAAGLGITVGKERRMEQVNARLCELLGYEEEELLGKSVTELTHPEDRAEDARAELQRASDPEGSVRLRKRLLHKDGHPVWVLVRSRRLPAEVGNDEEERYLGTVIDVSPEEALREEFSEMSLRYRLAMESSGIGVWEYNPNTLELFWDEQMLRIMGLSREAFWPRVDTWEQLVLAEDRTRARRQLARTVEEGVPFDEEFRIRRDGEIRHIKGWGEAMRDAEGKVDRVLGINYDITELRSTEEALRMSEQRFRSIAEGVPLGVYFMGLHGDLLWSNERVPEILGQRWEAIRGTGWQRFLHPEDRGRVVDEWHREHGQGEVLEARFRLQRADGSYCTIHRRAAPIVNAEGAVSGFTAVMEDITEKEALERELREARESLEVAQRLAALGSWRFNPRTGENWWSRELYRIFGRRPSEGAPGEEEFMSLAHAEDRGRLRRALEESYRTGQFNCRMRICRADTGAIRHVNARGVVRWNSEWEPVQHLGFVQDITQEHEREAALQEARDKAERANRAKSEFLAVMNHELRTPLNSIIGPVEILESINRDAESQSLLELVSTSSRHLLELINSVLDLARIESGHMETRMEEVELRTFAAERLGPLEARARAKGLDFACLFAEGFPEECRTDTRMLTQVLLNLVGNAVKFTESGSVRLQWEMEAGVTGHWLCCGVEDTGPGIPQAEQDRIFEPFQQVDMSYARKHGGTGLGLSITRSLVEALGGTLQLRSEEGKGSCFHFRIPVELVSDVAKEEAGETVGLVSREASELARRLAGQTVLVVEDNAFNRRTMECLLRELGVSCDSAGTGEAALQKAEAGHYPLILMDIALPDLDGLEVARRIRKGLGGRFAWIIAQTAFSLEQEKERFLAEGMDACLAKPVTLERLKSRLEEGAEQWEAAVGRAGPNRQWD